MKDPQEFVQIQTEFVSRQGQLFGDQTKELGQSIMQGAEVTQTTLERSAEKLRNRSEAA